MTQVATYFFIFLYTYTYRFLLLLYFHVPLLNCMCRYYTVCIFVLLLVAWMLYICTKAQVQWFRYLSSLVSVGLWSALFVMVYYYYYRCRHHLHLPCFRRSLTLTGRCPSFRWTRITRSSPCLMGRRPKFKALPRYVPPLPFCYFN